MVSDAESLMITLDDYIQQIAGERPDLAAFLQVVHDHMYEANEMMHAVITLYYQNKFAMPEFHEAIDSGLHLIFEP